jgi:hypothetical protein
VATQYDKTRKSLSAFLDLAAAKLGLAHFTGRPDQTEAKNFSAL